MQTPTRETIRQATKRNCDELTKDCKIFFAFNDKQFSESKPALEYGDKIVSIGHGAFMPKSLHKKFKEGWERIYQEETEAIKAASPEEREKIILDELINHEAFYTGSISDTRRALHEDFTKDEVIAVYNKHSASAER